MKTPKLKHHNSVDNNGYHYLVGRKTKLKIEPDLVVSYVNSDGEDETVKLWFQKYWLYRVDNWDDDTGYDHIMECPRTGLLMMSYWGDYDFVVDAKGIHEDYLSTTWAYFPEPVQKLYREYRATWELEEAMLKTK